MAKESKGKKSHVHKRILGFIPGLVLLLVIIMLFRSCTGGHDKAAPNLSLRPGATAQASGQVQLAHAQPLNARCAAFTLVPQRCELKSDSDGSDWIGLGPDFSDGDHLCIEPNAGSGDGGPYRQITLLLDDGTTRVFMPGDTPASGIMAAKIIPKRPIMLLYHLGKNGSCA